MRSLKLLVVAASITSGVTLAACGGAAPASHTSSAACAGVSAAAPIPAADRSPQGTWGTQPTVVVPSGAAPSQFECSDLIVGTGAAATNGDGVEVQYVLATYSTRSTIQSSWSSQPFSFTLGEGQVITGWDDGVLGMRVGGRRELILPPSLGYGDTSPGSGIAKDDTLVFVIDVLKICTSGTC